MEKWTREHSYYMAQLFEYHITYEIGTNWLNNTKRLDILTKKYDEYTNLHNSYEKTLPSN